MACSLMNTSTQTDLTQIPLSYRMAGRPKRYYLQEEVAPYQANIVSTLMPDEIIEQCLALVYAILDVQHHGVKESLTLILQERLQLLQNQFA